MFKPNELYVNIEVSYLLNVANIYEFALMLMKIEYDSMCQISLVLMLKFYLVLSWEDCQLII